MQYDNVYYHDYHGWRATLSEYDQAFNKFVANGSENLESVSFYNAMDSVSYTVKVFDRFEGDSLLDELAVVNGTIDHKGFHTVDLDTPVVLTAGDDFYIYVYVSDGGQAIDRTSTVDVLLGANSRGTLVPSSASADESYFWDGSMWQDLQTYTFSDPSWDGTANFCIKALTNDYTPVGMNSFENEINPESFQLKQNYPNPFNPETNIAYRLSENSQVELVVYNALGQKIKTLVNKEQGAGEYSIIWNGKDDFDTYVSSGVYLYQLKSGSFVMSKKMVLLR